MLDPPSLTNLDLRLYVPGQTSRNKDSTAYCRLRRVPEYGMKKQSLMIIILIRRQHIHFASYMVAELPC